MTARRRARVDGNHAEIRDGLRSIPGVTVADAARLGGGFPDLVVGFRGRTYLLEVKDGDKPPSARRLTAAERVFQDGWTGHYAVVEDLTQAVTEVCGLYADMSHFKVGGTD